MAGYVALVILAFSELLLVIGQTGGSSQTIVPNSDPGITYSPEYCGNLYCPGAWWDTTVGDSTVRTTAGPSTGYGNAQTTLSYSFYGSSLEIHGLGDVNGANMIVQIDNFLAPLVNTSTGNGGKVRLPFLLGNYSNLDPSTVHTLSIGWSKNEIPNLDAGGYYPLSYIYFDHLAIGDFRAVEGPSSTSFSSEASSTTSSPTAFVSSPTSTSKGIKADAIVGIVVAVLAFVLLLCVVLFYIVRRRRPLSFLRRGPASRHIEVMIESQTRRLSNSGPSPPPSASWKARPHLSLPPAYLPPKDGDSSVVGYGGEKGVSYLDLESGSTKSIEIFASSSQSTLSGQQGSSMDGQTMHPYLLSPPSSSCITVPPKAKLYVNTRESMLAPRLDPFARYDDVKSTDMREHPPVTPITPYSVGTATVARPQNAQLIPKPRKGIDIGLGSSSNSDYASRRQNTVQPLPPVTSSENEKERQVNSRSRQKRTRKRSSEKGGKCSDIRKEQIPELNATLLELELSAAVAERDARPSFDAISIMTRSVPPPYALHV